MNILDNIGQAQINAVTEQREIPEFGPGDTLKINVKVVEGSRERVQAFEGVCIGRSNRGINSSFTVRKISYGEGVERIFPLYSPKIQSRLGFLYSSYVKNAEFWEVHEIVRKTVLTGAIIYLQTLPSVQVGVATMVCTFTIGTLNYFKPQKSRIVFWLAQLSFLVTTFKFISA